MLTIHNIQNIEGKEFEMISGQKYIIGIVRAYYDHYSFGVFPLVENNVASLKDAIVYKLYKDKSNERGYPLICPKMNRIAYVKPENLTMDNFILELHIQTGILNAYNRK